MVHQFPGWTDVLRSLQALTLLIFGDRDFSPLPDVVELFALLPNAQRAVLPGTTHVGVTRRPGEVLALIRPARSCWARTGAAAVTAVTRASPRSAGLLLVPGPRGRRT